MRRVQLVIVDGPDTGRTFPVTGAIAIGRDPSAGIVLQDDQVSRRHAVITAAGEAPCLDDLDSRNGTWVNGERIGTARELLSGDEIRLGTTIMELRAWWESTGGARVLASHS